VVADLRRYGFNRGTGRFWSEIEPEWRKRLNPQPSYARIDGLNDEDWGTTFSIGEINMTTTALHISRFLQAVGNYGTECAPAARRAQKSAGVKPRAGCTAARRVVEEATARKLSTAMRDTVKRGSAKGIANALDGTRWAIGGKTGTGGIPGAPLDRQDGCFAGLVFDPEGKARFTVATFVRRGGRGGGNAAEISAQLARFMMGR
jgi:cell division protein FtsI/penicillin-binding protein 2